MWLYWTSPERNDSGVSGFWVNIRTILMNSKTLLCKELIKAVKHATQHLLHINWSDIGWIFTISLMNTDNIGWAGVWSCNDHVMWSWDHVMIMWCDHVRSCNDHVMIMRGCGIIWQHKWAICESFLSRNCILRQFAKFFSLESSPPPSKVLARPLADGFAPFG